MTPSIIILYGSKSMEEISIRLDFKSPLYILQFYGKCNGRHDNEIPTFYVIAIDGYFKNTDSPTDMLVFLSLVYAIANDIMYLYIFIIILSLPLINLIDLCMFRGFYLCTWLNVKVRKLGKGQRNIWAFSIYRRRALWHLTSLYSIKTYM